MIGSGVETTSGGDEFACLLHTQEHFTPGFVVIAGGTQDVVDGAGSRLLI